MRITRVSLKDVMSTYNKLEVAEAELTKKFIKEHNTVDLEQFAKIIVQNIILEKDLNERTSKINMPKRFEEAILLAT